MTFVGSPQQKAIWEALQQRNAPHLVIDAKAGTGKTFTCVHGAALLPSQLNIVILCFNSHIGKELTVRLRQAGAGRNSQGRTFNSFGWQSLLDHYGSDITLEEDKLPRLIADRIPESDLKYLASPLEKVVRLLKCHMLDGSPADVDMLVDRYAFEWAPSTVYAIKQAAAQILKDCLNGNTADFDDQIWLTLKRDIPVKNFHLVMVDEAQDTNEMQKQLIMKAAQSTGRIVVVGDRNQAIYGFRGAGTNSIAELRATLEGTKRGCEVYPLTVSRRCARSHIRMAQAIVPEIEALEEAPEGIVESLSEQQAIALMKPNDLVLCRTNAPLIHVCYSLIRDGRKAVIRGRTIGQGLLTLLKRLRPTDVADLMEKIGDYEDREMRKLEALGRKGANRIANLQDKCECMIAMCEGMETLSEIENRIGTVFADYEPDGQPKRYVLLGTVHRTKGLEANTVFVLAPEQIPHSMAKQKWEHEQEANLAYVAVTRAKYELPEHQGRIVFCGAIPAIYSAGVCPVCQGKGEMRVVQNGTDCGTKPCEACGKIKPIPAQVACNNLACQIAGMHLDNCEAARASTDQDTLRRELDRQEAKHSDNALEDEEEGVDNHPWFGHKPEDEAPPW